MRKPIICIPVVGNSINEFLNNLSKSQKISNFVELRSDYIQKLNIEDILLLKSKTFNKSIFTCRSKKEGGKFTSSQSTRCSILEFASKIGFDFVDVELSTLEKYNLKLNSKLIISYHNFNKTPNFNFLLKIISKMQKYKPEIIKIATLVKNKTDIKTLLRLCLNKDFQNKRIIIGMGPLGISTRILAPLFGSYLTYSYAINNKTASGQIEFSTLKKLYNYIYK
ncbi:MAG: type I 3-dehydroquinate dehydratase [Bacteroidetes bacterium]|nr:type I 3-dehydroquinate dehydratase [Bacteroidota bacterium]